MNQKHPTLSQIAHQAMLESGFLPDFSAEEMQETQTLKAAPLCPSCRDLREKLWVSIDNDDSRDLDQLTYAEKDHLFVAIADVDGSVKKSSLINIHAEHNTTSVYTPGTVFPMLPLRLSTNLTSLNENEERNAIVVEMEITESGLSKLIDIYPALVKNHAKLAYPSLGAWLEGNLAPHAFPPIHALPDQLRLQQALTARMQQYRDQLGSLNFERIEWEPVMVNGIAVSLKERPFNQAHLLIENAMIGANIAATTYLMNKQITPLFRIVRIPKRWDRIVALAKNLNEALPERPDAKALQQFLSRQKKVNPLHFPDLSLAIIKLIGKGEYVAGLPPTNGNPGHFDLALHNYTHATAPNRRYPDLLMQRLIKSTFFHHPLPYNVKELSQLAAHCTQKEDDAKKLERRLLKCAAAMVLEKDVGKTFTAMVTGTGPKGTWVRVQTPPIEGKLVHRFEGVDVGDFLKVRLVRVHTFNGHIDFARE